MANLKQPNILFLFTDDQRFNTIGGLNNPNLITPAMDSLVKDGTSFTNAYIMGGSCPAVCMPSRAMLMTGRTLFNLDDLGQEIPMDHSIMPEIFRREGYTTFGTGKWHNGRAAYARSFTCGDVIFFGGMEDHWNVPAYDFDPSGIYPAENAYRRSRRHSSELFSDAAVNFLQNYQDDKPFFMYVSYMAPHDPRTMPKEYLDLYDPEEIELPPNFMAKHPFDNGELWIRDENLAAFPRTESEIRRHIADYYAMITHVDAQIGRVLDALQASGYAENTIIVFSGDNGLAVGQHGLMGKQNMYEHSLHVPLIFKGSGIPAGEQRDAFCYLLDIYPTLCDLTGITIPGSVQGKSLSPCFSDMASCKQRDSLYFAYRDVQRCVREGQYKLVEYAVNGQKTTQLFDIKADPWELNSLADDPQHRQELEHLREKLLEWREETNDKRPQEQSFWDTYLPHSA